MRLSSGSSSDSNQGFFRIQPLLRQEGCGNGSTAHPGPVAAQDRTPVAHGFSQDPVPQTRPDARLGRTDQSPAISLSCGIDPISRAAPGRRTFAPRRQVAALGVKPGKTEAHRHDGEIAGS
jgi:hypothetical protein